MSGILSQSDTFVPTILSEAERCVEGKNPQVWMKGEEKEFLISIRNGEQDANNVKDRVIQKIKQIQNKLETSTIPSTIDEIFLNNWLRNLRINTLVEYINSESQSACEFRNRNTSKDTESIEKSSIVDLSLTESELQLKKMAKDLLISFSIKGTILFCRLAG